MLESQLQNRCRRHIVQVIGPNLSSCIPQDTVFESRLHSLNSSQDHQDYSFLLRFQTIGLEKWSYMLQHQET